MLAPETACSKHMSVWAAERLHMYYNHTKKSSLLGNTDNGVCILCLAAALKEFDQLKKDYVAIHEKVN